MPVQLSVNVGLRVYGSVHAVLSMGDCWSVLLSDAVIATDTILRLLNFDVAWEM